MASRAAGALSGVVVGVLLCLALGVFGEEPDSPSPRALADSGGHIARLVVHYDL